MHIFSKIFAQILEQGQSRVGPYEQGSKEFVVKNIRGFLHVVDTYNNKVVAVFEPGEEEDANFRADQENKNRDEMFSSTLDFFKKISR